MNSRKFALTLLLMISLSIATTAKATTVNFCFGWDIEYNSASANGDYLTNNSVDVPAVGVAFIVNKKITALYWQTVYTGNAGSDGCKTFNLDYGETYRVIVKADAYVGGNNQFRTYSPDDNNPEEKGTLYAQYVTSLSGFVLNTSYKYFSYEYIEPYRTSNVMAASTHAFQSNRVGIENDELDFLAIDEEEGTNGGYNDPSQLIRLEDLARDSKFTIAHEMGHFVHYVTNDHEGFLTGCSDTGEDSICLCDGCHAYESKENQGCAAKEGFANFYSAAVFNNHYDTGCFYRYDTCDQYHTTMVDDCQPTPPFLYNYFDGYGVEADWTEFYWHLHAGSQYWSLADITDLFNYVDTTDWDGGGHDNVIESLSEAAHALFGATAGNYFDDQSDLGEGGACDDACIGF